MKKILSLVLAVALVLTLSCAALAEGYSGDLKVWVADAAVDFTNQQVEAFKAANPDFADMTVTVEAVGEGDAAGKVITDVDAAADIFGWWPPARLRLSRRTTPRSSRPRTTRAPWLPSPWATSCTPTR